MTLPKITLMEAYQIETLRNKGFSSEEILEKAVAKDLDFFTALNTRFDFTVLINLADKDVDTFKEILTRGYQLKFVTINGLKNLLRLKFDKEETKDFQIKEMGVFDLVLSEGQLQTLNEMLSKNWKIEKSSGGTVNITIG